ncbi:MAG: CCA tRNA nucleotidyltransferase [Candidatus Eisenbacteria bacterium]
MIEIAELAGRVEQELPAGAREVVRRVTGAGGRICLVGGSIRDLLLGGEAHDWDFATDLPPEQVRRLFARAIDAGVRFGTVLVLEPDGPFEITTFRKEGIYSDARHPDTVVFTTSVEEDLARRDFTINAMAFDLAARELVDPFGGRDDLARRIVRTVGRPDDRFGEDALRMLRCIRIAGQLGFSIDDPTYFAIARSAPLLDAIARERIREEFDRILGQPRPSVSIERLYETGLLQRFLPELAACYGVPQNRYHAFDIFYHSLAAADRAPADNKIVRLAALLHDLGKVDTRRDEGDGRVTFFNHQAHSARKADAALLRLRYPTEERRRVVHLIQQHMFHYDHEWSDSAVRRFVRTVGLEHLDDLFATRAADTLGNGMRRSASSPELRELRGRIGEILDREAALSVRDLKIGGVELMERLGVRPGPLIGRILAALLEEVLEDPAKNEPETLLRRAEELRPAIEAELPARDERHRDRES